MPNNERRPAVAIAGAGLAGLCLAQRLRAAGVDVHVYEADQGPFVRRQGYRITVDKYGLAALRESLPNSLMELALATADVPGGYFRFTNAQLRDAFKMRFRAKPGGPRQMDRQVLRSVLLVGLEDRVHYGKAVDGLESDGSGRPVLRFCDGTVVSADVVVGADGIGSALRRQILPGAEPEIMEIGGIYGRTRLVCNGESILPAALRRSGVMALGDAPGRAFFFTSMHFHESPGEAFGRLAAGRQVAAADDYVMWAITLMGSEFRGLTQSDSATLRSHAGKLATDFHPLLQELVAAADDGATILTTFAVGRRPVKWSVPYATLIGDAVHPMPPTGAHGGNTALRDAALLGSKLAAAYRNNGSLASAIRDYQTAMAPYAFKAVDAATSMMRRMAAAGPIQRWLLLRALPRLHRVSVADTS
jgi:2-polyprenyl-6-methoxyphenol hydroxylase-like FAD-dependent oxidoreductase